MNKNISQISLKPVWIFTGIVTSFLVLYTPIDSLLYDNERYGYELGEKYAVIDKRYEIGLQNGRMQICDAYVKYGCLNGELKGLKTLMKGPASGITIFYFKLDSNKANLRENSFGSGYVFSLFGPYDERIVNRKEDLPKFGWIGGYDLSLVGENDLHVLVPETQQAFRDLEKHPTIIINGKDYSGKLQ